MSKIPRPTGFPAHHKQAVDYITKLAAAAKFYHPEIEVALREGKGWYVSGFGFGVGNVYIKDHATKIERWLLADIATGKARARDEKRRLLREQREAKFLASLSADQLKMLKQLKWGPYKDDVYGMGY